MTRTSFAARFLALLLAVVLTGTACAADRTDDAITVLAIWSGSEKDIFVGRVLAEFTRQTGLQVRYRQATRAVDQELEKDLQTGTQPDVAFLSSPGQLLSFAAQGALKPLDNALGGPPRNYGPQWSSLLAAIDPGGKATYAIPYKVNLKSAIWYSPEAMSRLLGPAWRPPATWADLVALTTEIHAHGVAPWCLGLESTPVSGWPGTDWVEDILLHQSGPESYRNWVNGTLKWQSENSAPVKALAAWGDLIGHGTNLDGGTEGALLAPFGDAAKRLLTANPSCYLFHSAYQDKLDFFSFPAIDSPFSDRYEVSADFAAMFSQNPHAESLIRFLTSGDAQTIWPGAVSADRTVKPEMYSDKVSRRIAHLISGAGDVCFDASDLMPASLSDAFDQAVLTYVSDPARYSKTANAGALLANLDKVADQPTESRIAGYHCGKP